MVSRRKSLIADIDWITVLLYLSLVVIGWVSIYSAGYSEEHSSMLDLTQQYGKQALWIAVAIILSIFVMAIDQRFFETFSYVIYGGCILLLLTVLAVGVEVKGAKSWIDFGFFRLQPAEFTKIGTAMALSNWMSRHNFNMEKTRDFVIMGAILLTPMLLILLQNDTGSALTYSAFVILFYRRGLNPLYIQLAFLVAVLFITVTIFSPTPVMIVMSVLVIGFLIYSRFWGDLLVFASSLAVCLLVVWLGSTWELFQLHIDNAFYLAAIGTGIYWLLKGVMGKQSLFSILGSVTVGSYLFTLVVPKVFDLMQPHQQDRILILLGQKSDPYGVEYHVIQSLIAIGSGGARGKGFLQGTQTKFDFVPEQTTDFIFSTIGEEFGFMGTSLVILLFTVLMIRLIVLAERQRSLFSKNYAYCIVGIIFVHFAINIGMVTGVGPVIGVPLPLLSYGGSSLWAFTLLIFIFLKMDARRMEVLI